MSGAALLGPDGRRITVGAKLGQGGEGAIYEIVGSGDVAKVYASTPTSQRIAKLAALVHMQSAELRAIAAWPLGTIDSQGSVAGFVMPQVTDCVPLSRILIPQTRKEAFPRASWAWLAHCARNLAIAMDAVHRAGVVIGDVNESNFLVRRDTSVHLIDVDSFQVRDGQRVLTCDVGVPMFVPPELQGKPFAGLVRTPDHDRFGLAVLIFQLLFMGRHPWAGTHAGPELSFEEGELIRTLPFAWGRDARGAGFHPPKDSVRMEWLPPRTANLFERALAARGSAPSRPAAREWVEALDAFEAELRACEYAPIHQYVPGRGECPWCVLEAGTPPLYFFVTAFDGTRRVLVLDIASIERDVSTMGAFVPELQPFSVKTLPRAAGYTVPAELRKVREDWWAGCLFFIAVTIGFAALFGGVAALWVAFASVMALVAVRPKLAALRTFRSGVLAEARTRYANVVFEWQRANDMTEFAQRKGALLEAIADYKSLAARYAAQRKLLQRQKRGQQLRAHLERYALEDAKITSVGKKRKAILYAYGYHTAADLGRIASAPVPGLGVTCRYALQTWHEHVKARFRFDPAAPPDAKLLHALETREQAERVRLEAVLRFGPRRYAAALEQRRRERDDLRLPLEAAAIALNKAIADVKRVTLLPFA